MKLSSKNNTLLSPQLKFRRLILIFLLIPLIVGAIDNPINAQNFETLIDEISGFFFTFGIALAPIAIIAGTYQLITAGGDPAKIEMGKKIIIYALIGVSVILMAKAIINEILPVLQNI